MGSLEWGASIEGGSWGKAFRDVGVAGGVLRPRHPKYAGNKRKWYPTPPPRTPKVLITIAETKELGTSRSLSTKG